MNKSDKKINRDNLLYHLGLLARRWRQLLDAEFQAVGLTDATWRPLLHLHLLGDGVRQKDLAASVGITGPSLVHLLDTLVSKKLLLRSEDGTDRRAKLLFLTEEGQQLVAQIQDIIVPLENQLLSKYSNGEVTRFGQFILALEASVSEVRQRGKQ